MRLISAKELLVYLWRSGRWYLVPIALVLVIFGVAIQGCGWVVRLPGRLAGASGQARRRQLKREMEAEGRQLYPLW